MTPSLSWSRPLRDESGPPASAVGGVLLTMVVLAWLVWQRWPAGQIEQRVKFLVFDTAREDLVINHNGRAVMIEPDTEFHDIGQTPVANIKRNLARKHSQGFSQICIQRAFVERRLRI